MDNVLQFTSKQDRELKDAIARMREAFAAMNANISTAEIQVLLVDKSGLMKPMDVMFKDIRQEIRIPVMERFSTVKFGSAANPNADPHPFRRFQYHETKHNYMIYKEI